MQDAYSPSMNLTPQEMSRPLAWSPIIEELAKRAANPTALYLVGGVVRDALLGRPAHDIDMATGGDGLAAARQLADAFEADYYPVDPERRTGRVILSDAERTVIDVATFRGEGLFEDLQGRDFTINAIAAPLGSPNRVIDPLDGKGDLLIRKVLRMCAEDSISSDPIRALRAVRMTLAFKLRMAQDTVRAIKDQQRNLLGADGTLQQPERTRDALFAMLDGQRPVSGLRLLDTLGMLETITPPRLEDVGKNLTVVERLHELQTIISPKRTDNTASQLILGMGVMVLDRYRQQLQEHLALRITDERSMASLALLAAVTPLKIPTPGEMWGNWLRLSRREQEAIENILTAQQIMPDELPVGARQAHRYYRATGEAGISGVLLRLALFLSRGPHGTLDADRWMDLLESQAAPLLDAFFRQHQQIVSPPPLIDGRDLQRALDVKPGPVMGDILEQLLEEQAAGSIRTQEEALEMAQRLLEQN